MQGMAVIVFNIVFNIPQNSIYLKVPNPNFLQKDAMLSWCFCMVFSYKRVMTDNTRVSHMTQENKLSSSP